MYRLPDYIFLSWMTHVVSLQDNPDIVDRCGRIACIAVWLRRILLGEFRWSIPIPNKLYLV